MEAQHAGRDCPPSRSPMAPTECCVDATSTCGEGGRSYPGRSGGGSSCQKSAEAIVVAETLPRRRAEQRSVRWSSKAIENDEDPTAPRGGRRQANEVKPRG